MTATKQGGLEMERSLKIIQPSELFKVIDVKNTPETNRVLSTSYGFLLYMKKGDVLETSSTRFEKISDDLIHISSGLEPSDVVEALERRKLIKIPV